MPRPLVRRHPSPEQASPLAAAEVEGAGVPDADSTKDEIKAHLDALGVEYTTRMTKDELLELI